MQGTTISSRKELNNAAKEFFQQWKDEGKLSPEEYKQAVKESQKLSTITYPSAKALVVQEFMNVLMSSVVGDDHPDLAFFQEEQKKIVAAAAAAAMTSGGTAEGEGDDVPAKAGGSGGAPVVAPAAGGTSQLVTGSEGKRTLAGLKAHMRQAKERIEAAKALIRAEEEGTTTVATAGNDVTLIGTSSSGSSGSNVVVVLDGFATAVGAEQASAVSSSVFSSVEAVVGPLASSILAPTTTYNGEQVYSGVVLVACADLPTSRKVTEIVTEKSAAGAWDGQVASSQQGPRVAETKTSGGSNLRQLGDIIARDRATKVILLSNGSSGTAGAGTGATEIERQKRGRE